MNCVANGSTFPHPMVLLQDRPRLNRIHPGPSGYPVKSRRNRPNPHPHPRDHSPGKKKSSPPTAGRPETRAHLAADPFR